MRIIRKTIRVRKEDSAFVYFIMEAQEGVMSYRTLPNRAGDRFRDLELVVPLGFVEQAQKILQSLPEVLFQWDSTDPYCLD